MRTTIDAAGRVVIPKALRERAGLLAGEVEVSLAGAAVLVSAVAGDETVEDGDLLVIPTAGLALDDDAVRRMRLADQR